MTRVLAIETSTEYCSAAVVATDAGGILGAVSRGELAGQKHSQRLLGMVSEVLDEANVTLAECDAVAFGAGPGSFTGLRIACAVTQGIALGAGLPVVPISTLLAMAEEARQRAGTIASGTQFDMLVAQDARMGEIYWSLFRYGPSGWEKREGPFLDKPEQLARLLPAPIAFGCGSGFTSFAAQLNPAVTQVISLTWPHARAVGELALVALLRGEAIAPDLALPEYVRNRVAQTTEERSHAAAAMR